MKRKIVSLILSVAMVAGVLAGCGNGQTDKPDDTKKTEATDEETEKDDAGNEEVILRFSWWGGDERLAATLAVIEQFEDLHPNIKIEPEYGSSDGYIDKISTQLAGGTAPDIIQVDPGFFPKLVTGENSYFVDLNEYDFDFSKFEPSYYQQQINGCFDGKQYGIPTGIAGLAMLFNEDLAKEIGIDFTEDYTWDDLLTWGEQVKAYDEDMYLLASNKTNLANVLLFEYVEQLIGKNLTDSDAKLVNATEAELTEVYEYFKKLYDMGVVAPASHSAAYDGDNIQSDPYWIDGKYVATFVHISTLEVLTAANTNATYNVGMLPVMEGAKDPGFSTNCPQVLGVSAASEHPEEAVMFLDYFYNNSVAMETLGTVRSVPPTAEARQICEDKGILSALLKDSADYASSYGGLTNDTYSDGTEVKQILKDQVEAVGYGVLTPAEAAKETIKLLNDFISNQP